MRLAVFVVLLLVAVVAVGTWSWVNGAGIGVILLRMVITMVTLQIGYFLLVFLSAYVPGKTKESDKTQANHPESPPGAKAVSDPDD
ncbi:hypothetical protein [Roseovarius aestuarii]|uniref:Exopolysaccharide production repressor exox n=1 Tax=Roseovarius aestuarii TaxID=475083 RepID=A0A1X7BTD8_9RHOB|nr:hypothetical protein [Roseovarius aestuarii]SMC12855.1 hypothetical protein ROA7745_02687 [Roseovarius aestuarii]